ncbi:DNA polymerase alpha subunit B N-terminal-domain-containing protein [Pyronema domesticum]|uniref:DNA polymerase alpha subunit B n=1 Tax=Pyronema omphalodes (strain CBS 100304) TaxID=1076935 RepID=U4LCT2_PYROM|nr:DNA polymerase alpha subunit B N-terminal-domain-containing protein [Pyronema domesticum]CCX16686.1 Similar to DNA polymerase alpha subunit B; acc. no. O74946 [Pyronema omphalodes CBS 100304]
MDIDTTIADHFPAAPQEVLDELQAMLRVYDIDAQELFFKWESYSLKMGPDNVKLDFDTVQNFKKDVQEQLEKELKGKAKLAQNPAVQRVVRPGQGAGDSFALFDGMLPSTPARGGLKRKPLITETPRAKNTRMDMPSTPGTPFSSLKNSLESTTPFKTHVPVNETLEILNPHIPAPSLPTPNPSSERVSFLFNMELKNFSYRPMYQKLAEASSTQDDRIDEFSAIIQEHYNLPDSAFGDPTIASADEVVAVGRIVSDSLAGKFNPQSILLESSRMTGAGSRIPLKLDSIRSFAFFPGQIIAVKGVNSGAGFFSVSEVLEPPKLPPASSSTEDLALHNEKLADGPLSIWLASGPFTTHDNLDFSALTDLTTSAAEKKPDVVILCGPFIDSTHPLISSGDFDTPNPDGTLDDLFRHEISRRLAQIPSTTTVLLLPSLRDACSRHLSFPQAPLPKKPLELPQHVKCLPNPSMFSLNELSFAISTNDILFHLAREEISRNPTVPNPQARLAGHILNQRSFYPLFPPPDRESLPMGLRETGASLDIPHIRLADVVGVTPDVLVLPSALAAGAKVVEGTVVVNPGQVRKSRGPGTWAEMCVVAGKTDEEGDERRGHSVWERARVEVKRI